MRLTFPGGDVEISVESPQVTTRTSSGHLNPANVPHMPREELEDACAHLKLMFCDADTDGQLRAAVLWELTEQSRRDNTEELRDERSDSDVYEGVE